MTPSPSSESAPGAFPEASCHEPLGTDSCSLSFPFFFFFFGSSAAASGSLASPTTDQPVGEAAAAAGRRGSIGVIGSAGAGAGAGVHTSSTGAGSKVGGATGGASNWPGEGTAVPTSQGELDGASGAPLPTCAAAAGGGSYAGASEGATCPCLPHRLPPPDCAAPPSPLPSL